ncbi:HNH endonuclease [Hymenobacter sp. 5414T-23]|uniref:HNH endonuclease n=1 Tax=Hymenobacter sp. 5414T-23 TaxID=2932252 RepID=UPI001FD2D8F6|nr:HNH endonuclease [Hymenobacter sp. 5414T-23]UOQ81000.1 HNH endonuclease [Hymenobacter sp. 5414T-23]
MMQQVIVSTEVLETRYLEFKSFIEKKDAKPFASFKSSEFLIKEEGYKSSIYKAARQSLNSALWKIQDIGKGIIQNYVASTIIDAVEHGDRSVNNNLIVWSNKDLLKDLPSSKDLDAALYDLYKNKVTDEKSFDRLQRAGLNYQFLAYLFFIKDQNIFTPISQEKFDKIFSLIGIPEFRTSRNISWENYKAFIDIIKQVRGFLKTKDKEATLLDAHSFLWVLGNQMLEAPVAKKFSAKPQVQELVSEVVPQPEDAPHVELPVIAEEDEASAFPEGKEKFRLHRIKERSRELVNAVKDRALQEDEKLCCQACGFSFVEKYGKLGEGFIEAHHLFPISELKEETQTKLDDLALVCSNCHRMLHRRRPWLTLENLKALLQLSSE